MKMLVLPCPGVITNSGGLTIVAVINFTNGAGALSSPNLAAVSVPVVPLVLEQAPIIFLINRINDYFRRFPLLFSF